MNKQLTLLGYSFNGSTMTLELMALVSHENSYRDLKRRKEGCGSKLTDFFGSVDKI